MTLVLSLAFSDWAISLRNKKEILWKNIVHTFLWPGWIERHHRIFGKQDKDYFAFFDNVVLLAITWCIDSLFYSYSFSSIFFLLEKCFVTPLDEIVS